MRNLTDPKLMYLKAALFVLLGCASAALLLAAQPSLRTAALVAILVWSCCRAYYFAFYVLERYVDPSFRFSGLGSLIGYLVRRRAR